MGAHRYIFPVLFVLFLALSVHGRDCEDTYGLSVADVAGAYVISPVSGYASGEAELSGTSSQTTGNASALSLKSKFQKTWINLLSCRFDGLSSLAHIVEKEHAHPLCDMRFHRHIIFLEKILI